MITEYKNVPCVVEYENEFFKVEKPKNFFNKHREMESKNVKFHYIDETITGMKEVAIALRDLEDKLKGVIRISKPPEQREYLFKYRVNENTVLEAYTEEDLNKLKKWYNVND